MLKLNRNYYFEIDDINGQIVKVGFPLTCDFEVSRNTMGGIQNAEFTIFNLGQDTRRRITKNTIDQSPNNPRYLKWYAGYGPTVNLPLVFHGLLLTCSSVREPGSTDWQTSLSCQDPGIIPSTDVSLPVTPQLSRLQAVQSLIAKMPDISLGEVGHIFDSDQYFTRGGAYSGSFLKVFGELTGGNHSGGNYFFENQILKIILPNEAVQDQGFSLLNSSTGLLGAPYYEQTYVFANMLFEPRIKMGQLVDLESDSQLWLNGSKKVVGYNHSGTISGSIGGQAQTQIQLSALLNSAGFQIIGGQAGIF